jgi:hypothetical protein
MCRRKERRRREELGRGKEERESSYLSVVNIYYKRMQNLVLSVKVHHWLLWRIFSLPSTHLARTDHLSRDRYNSINGTRRSHR